MTGKTGLLILTAVLLLGAGLHVVAAAADSAATTATAPTTVAAATGVHPKFDTDIAPVFNHYCTGCHSGAQPKGDIMLSFKDEADARSRMATNDEFFDKVSTMLSGNLMPPANVKNRPTDAERKLLVDWINNDMLTIGGKPDPGPMVVHRLNSREYANTVRELLYLPASYDPTADFPADERGDGFDNNSDTLTISPVLIEHYLHAAQKATAAAFKPAPTDGDGKKKPVELTSQLNVPGKDILDDYPNPGPKLEANLGAFLTRAYRRPATKAEIDWAVKFAEYSIVHDGFSGSASADLAVDHGEQLAMRAALMSPNFLFRLERDPAADGTGKVYQLTEYQLASRLSYFLWSTMPDDELFAQAKAGTLRQNLAAQVTRMLQDPKAISLTKDFMGQWLEVRGLDQTPNLDKALAASERGETEHFFNYIVSNNRPVTDMLDANYSFVDGRLAKLYGIPGITGDDFHKVTLDPNQRFGVITQASILTLTSKPLGDGLRTSPIVRGKYILENLFNQKIPPPPPDVPPLAVDENHPLTGTTRQIFEQHRTNPVCAGCHARMEPYGFALENYAGNGTWRTQENGIALDVSGEINGHKFVNPAEFRQVLLTREDDFRHAVVRKVLSYALGRGIQGGDRPAVEQIVAQIKAHGDTFNGVIMGVVQSFPFQNARGGRATQPGAVATGSTPNAAPAPGAASAAKPTGLQPVSLKQDVTTH